MRIILAWTRIHSFVCRIAATNMSILEEMRLEILLTYSDQKGKCAGGVAERKIGMTSEHAIRQKWSVVLHIHQT
jgi:hypothetical protein